MSTLPETAPRAAGRTSAVLVAADPESAREAGSLLRAAGFTVDEADTEIGSDRVVVLLPAGDAGERIEALIDHGKRLAGNPLVITMPADAPADRLRRALRAGADGIVLDDELDRTLATTVHTVAAGQLAFPRSMRRQIAPRPLSYREKEILSLVVLGYTNRQIADKLFLAESTVKTHLSSAFGKLDARSRAEAAALVLDPDAGYGLSLPVFDAAAPA